MATLQEMLLRPDVQPRVVSDTLALVDSELASKSGLSGTAVKVAFKAITAFAPGYYQADGRRHGSGHGESAGSILGGLPGVRRR